jgi:hypothetical protein
MVQDAGVKRDLRAIAVERKRHTVMAIRDAAGAAAFSSRTRLSARRMGRINRAIYRQRLMSI